MRGRRRPWEPAARAAVLLLACALAGCASQIEPDDLESALPVEVVDKGGSEPAWEFGTGELLAAARPQLRAFLDAEGNLKPAELSDATYAMESWLFERGRARAIVEFEVLPSEESPERVRFRVDPGPRVLRKKIVFEGVEDALEFLAPAEGETGAPDAKSRLQAMFTRPDEDPPVYRRRDVAAGLSTLENAYLERGYHDVRVVEAEPSWSEDRSRVEVRVRVSPGALHLVEGVEIRGELPADFDLSEAALEHFPGEPFRARSATEAEIALATALRGQGWLEVSAEGAAAPLPPPGADGVIRVPLVVTVAAGPRSRLRELRVSGLDRTDEDFLLGLLEEELRAGEVLTARDIDRARGKLFSSGLFERADLNPDFGEAAVEGERTVDLETVVQEIEARSVEIELGFGSYELARGGVRYGDRNLFGWGRELQVELEASLVSYGAQVRVIDPWLVGPDVLEIGAHADYRQEPSFERTRLGFDVTWRRRIDEITTLRSGYFLEAQKATNVDAALPGLEAEEDTFVFSAGLFSRILRDDRRGADGRPDPFVPVAGSLFEAGVLWSSSFLGGDLDFVELSTSWSSYHEIADGTVIAFGARIAARTILDDRPSLPIQERLFLGGDTSVRSFYQDELGPADESGDPLGGLSSLVGHVELRQRLAGAFHGALFWDVGTIGADSWDFGGPYGHAFGIGLRYVTPIGPIRLDFGYNPFERFGAEDPWALHFSLGFSF